MEEWVVLSKDRIIQHFTIKEGQCLAIGRGSGADVIINNPSVSRKHTSLELRGGFYFLNDLNSINGTRVNGRKINTETMIRKTDNIAVGKFILKLARGLGDEVEAGSVAAADDEMENQNQTIFVTGIYRNKGRVAAAPKKRVLSVLEGGASPTRLVLQGKMIRAGKDQSADLVIPGFFTAKLMFTIEYRFSGYFIIPGERLFRKIKLNGKAISSEKLLKSMDIIVAGGTKIRFA